MEATVVAGPGSALADAAQDVVELLRRENYRVTLLARRHSGHGLEDIRLLETLWGSELCVFLLSGRLSDAHVALAMAHAHGIPAVRLQYDPRSTDTSPALSGTIRWHQQNELLFEFGRQLRSYIEGLVRPVDLALSTSPEEAARSIGTMKWRIRDDNKWDLSNGPALIDHVHPDHSFVQDEVSRARAQMNTALGLVSGREDCMKVCVLLYDGLRRLRFGYETEAATGANWQAIRTPSQIRTHGTATCLDLACLFASLLEAAGQNPILAVLEGPGFAHALAGYRVRGEPAWDNRGIADLRGAVARGDAVLFEATGPVEADTPVGDERPGERTEKLLTFADAVAVANRMLRRPDTRLMHLVDVQVQRTIGSNTRQREG